MTYQALKGFIIRNKVRLALMAFVASILLSIPSMSQQWEIIRANAAEIALLAAGCELLFVAGIGLMLVSQKHRVFSRKLFSKSWMREILSGNTLMDNALLRWGLSINSVGAAGTGIVLMYGALTVLPGPMVMTTIILAAMDLAATVTIRYTLYQVLKGDAGIR